MSIGLYSAALMMPGFLRFGRLHLPVYGMFAAAGLIAALWLSQRTAARVGLSPEKLWDAGVFAIVAAFVVSRLLLIVLDLRSFVHFPLLVLAMPSLTYTGMLLMAIATWWYLRWKGMGWRAVADAWAPCAALLAAVLNIGHFVEGTEAGMPTTLPWGVMTAGDTVLGRVHPVQLYAAAFAVELGVVLFWLLRRRKFKGEAAVVAMMLGGAASFMFDMLRQPVDTYGTSALEAGQVVALLVMLGGGLIWTTAHVRAENISGFPSGATTKEETGAVAKEIA